MIDYQFYCEKCRRSVTIRQSIHTDLPKACKKCGATEPTFYQKFGDPFVMVENVTTFGQQAERNAKREGKEKMKLMEENYFKHAPPRNKLKRSKRIK